MILSLDFFARDTLQVAEELLGKYLVRRRQDKITAHLITEVEAYEGPEDLASHARFGETQRSKVMFGPPGVFYVYKIYGIHWMLNIVTREERSPSAILIRGLEGVTGPGRLTSFLEIDHHFIGKKAIPETGLWLEDKGVQVPSEEIVKGPRIGVDYAGPIWSQVHYRFRLKSHVPK